MQIILNIIRRCLYFVDLTTFYILGQKFVNFFVGFLEKFQISKRHSEINWPLACHHFWSTVMHIQHNTDIYYSLIELNIFFNLIWVHLYMNESTKIGPDFRKQTANYSLNNHYIITKKIEKRSDLLHLFWLCITVLQKWGRAKLSLKTTGQLISKEFFLVFRYSRKSTKCFTFFCPSL